jgi:hypothetical protein
LEGIAEKSGLGVYNGDQLVCPQIRFLQEQNIQFHRPDELDILLANHGFRGNKGALGQTGSLPEEFLKGHAGCNSVRVRTAKHEHRKGVILFDHGLEFHYIV